MYEHIEIGGFTTHPIGKALSNFHPRAFVFDGVRCASFEGLIQALKCPDQTRQREICQLSGKEAWGAGQEWNVWKDNQTLHWQGDTFSRESRGYMLLIERIYDAIYEQDETFKQHLLALGPANIHHSIGRSGQSKTTLIEAEMVSNIQRLRVRALYETLEVLWKR